MEKKVPSRKYENDARTMAAKEKCTFFHFSSRHFVSDNHDNKNAMLTRQKKKWDWISLDMVNIRVRQMHRHKTEWNTVTNLFQQMEPTKKKCDSWKKNEVDAIYSA